jgi:Ca2+-dependent lipid-binding protein
MDTQDIPSMDFEGTSDIYIKAYINHKEQFQTDTHYRCMSGKGSFNYRMLFNIQSPRKETQLVI